MAEGLRASNSRSGAESPECGFESWSCPCVREQDTLLQLLLFTQGYNWVPARVEVDIVYEKATSALQAAQGCILPRELRNITGIVFPEIHRNGSL